MSSKDMLGKNWKAIKTLSFDISSLHWNCQHWTKPGLQGGSRVVSKNESKLIHEECGFGKGVSCSLESLLFGSCLFLLHRILHLALLCESRRRENWSTRGFTQKPCPQVPSSFCPSNNSEGFGHQLQFWRSKVIIKVSRPQSDNKAPP